ncbi:MAG: hypothetical protein ACE5GK_01380 [Nitrospiria bacterium]
MSKFRTKINNILNSTSDLSEVDNYAKRYKCKYQTIYECLADGLTLDETVFVLDVHRSLPLTPFMATLRQLFVTLLDKDQEQMNEAISLTEENLEYLRSQVPEDIEMWAKDDSALKEFCALLSEQNGSLGELRDYLDQLEWQEELRLEWPENFE